MADRISFSWFHHLVWSALHGLVHDVSFVVRCSGGGKSRCLGEDCLRYEGVTPEMWDWYINVTETALSQL